MGRSRKHNVDGTASVSDTPVVTPVEEDSVEEEITEPVSPVGSVISHTDTPEDTQESGETQSEVTSCVDESCVSNVCEPPVESRVEVNMIDISANPIPLEAHVPTVQVGEVKKDEYLSVICRITGVPLYGTTRWPLKTGETLSLPKEAALHFSHVGMVRILK